MTTSIKKSEQGMAITGDLVFANVTELVEANLILVML